VNDGSIERVDLIGNKRTSLVPPGVTFTPKQLHFETVGRKLYWGDREGTRVMRCDIDGSNVETLIETEQGDRRDETRRYVADLDGSSRRDILVVEGNLTGIAYAELHIQEP
jgi:hypothetical protein